MWTAQAELPAGTSKETAAESDKQLQAYIDNELAATSEREGIVQTAAILGAAPIDINLSCNDEITWFEAVEATKTYLRERGLT